MKLIYKTYLILSIVLSATICSLQLNAAVSAEKTIEAVSKKLNSAKSLQVHFTLLSNGQAVKGEMLVAGNKFYIETPQIAAWHNGQFQWVLNKNDREVNLSQPDPVEIQQINPLSVISNFKNNFSATVEKSTTTQTVILLTPKQKSNEIHTASLTINKATSLPDTITVTLNNGQSISIHISSIKTGNKVNASVFQFDKKKYPNAQIIDLR